MLLPHVMTLSVASAFYHGSVGGGGGGGGSEGDFGIMARITSFIVNAKYLFVVVKTWTVTACSMTALLRLSSFFTFPRRATF